MQRKRIYIYMCMFFFFSLLTVHSTHRHIYNTPGVRAEYFSSSWKESSPVITYIISRKLRRYKYRGEIGHTQRPIYWVRKAKHAQASKSDELQEKQEQWRVDNGKWRNVYRYKQRKTGKKDAQKRSTRIKTARSTRESYCSMIDSIAYLYNVDTC